MAAKVTNCYRFEAVDFEPQTQALIWRDASLTHLSEDECRLLNVLCRHAGQTLSFQTLYHAARVPSTSFEQHQNNLSSLLAKSYHRGKKTLPIELVGNFGYRISLPIETFAKKNEQLIAELDPSFMTAKKPSQRAQSPQTKERIFLTTACVCFALCALLFVYLLFSGQA